MFDNNNRIEGYDDELAAAIAAEKVRQEDHIELIASDRFDRTGYYWQRR